MECGMERRFHRGFTAAEKTELWDRWKRGESLKAIGRAFGKQSSSIYFLVAPHGGIRPAERRRSRLALTLERDGDLHRRPGMDLLEVVGERLRDDAVGLANAFDRVDHAKIEHQPANAPRVVGRRRNGRRRLSMCPCGQERSLNSLVGPEPVL